MVVLRQASVGDIDTILTLNNNLCKHEMESGFDTYIPDWSLSEVSKEYFMDMILNQYVVLALVEDSIVGYLAGSIYSDGTYSYYEGTTAELDNMYIEPSCRSMGIGSMLIDSFEQWCKTKGASRIMVTASSKNALAQCFYKKNGFSDINVTLKKELK